MRTIFTKLLILGLAKFLLVTVFILLASISFGQTTENYDGAGTSNNQVLANGFAAFDYGGFTYQIISFNGANSSLLEILNWETYGNNGTDAIGVVGDENNKITVFKLTKTDGSAFSTSSLWMTSAGDSYTITGYNDGNTTGQSVSVSASFSGIKTLNFTGVDELRFEGTEIIVDLDDFTYTLGAANSAPTASSFTASPIYEGTSYVFATSDFSYSDGDGDPLDHIRITTVPGNGTLYVDADNDDTYDGGEELANNDQVSKANLDAGNLQYLNSNGTSSSFTFEVNDGTDYSASPYTATLTVTPEPTVSFTSASQSSTDESGTMTITAQLSNAFNKTVSVPFSLGASTSALGGGVDYSISSSPVTISAGSTTANITITIGTDALDEPNEDIQIVMGSPTNATASGTTTHTATITDDDDAPTVSFTIASQSSTDESGTMTITAQLSTASGKEVSVPFSIDALSTALGSGTDYSISVSPITIPASLTTAGITITITEDVLDEANETVIINMGTPTNATATGTTTHTATITDDDDAPSVTTQAVTSIYTTTATGNGTITALGTSSPITQYGVCWNTSGSPTVSDSKTQEGSTSATGAFTSSLTSLSEGTTYYVKAYAISAAGTAYGGEVNFKTNAFPTISIDNTTLAYTENDVVTQIDGAGTVSDADGDAEWNGGKLEVQIIANSEAADEISIVDSDGDGTAITISGTNLFANGVDVADLSASGGIVTSGTKLTITFDADASNSIVQEVLQSIRYRNTSENPGTSNRTITFTATDKNSGSASDTRIVSVTAENDVPTISINSTLSLNEGATGTITSASHLSATDLDNDDSGLIFTITTNTTNGDVKRSGTILNLNDTFTQADLVAGVITYTQDGSSTTSDSFVFKVSDGSDELINQTFNITVNDVTAPLLLSSSPLDDAANATLSGNIVLNFDDGMVAGTGNITIKKMADNSIFEQIPIGDAKINISSSQITINSAGTLEKGTVYYIEIDGTALDDDGGNSFAGISGNFTLNFTTVDVVINEVVTDPQQDWSSTLFASAPGGISGSNDEWVELYINSTGIDLTGWTIELLDGSDITGDLTNIGAFAVSNYIGSGSFANTIAGDYLVLGNPAGAGLLNNSITINIKDPGGAIVDAVVLGGGSGEAPDGSSMNIYNESVQRYTNGLDTDLDANDFTQGQASIGAVNTGPSVILSASSAIVAEASGVSTITASLSAVSSQDVTVTLAVNGSSSARAGDYNLSSGSIVISAGNLSNTAILTATQDPKDENDETVIIDIIEVTGGTEEGAQQETVTIADDDDAPSVAFNSVSSNGLESVSSIDLQVDLSAASGLTVTVDYTVTGTASGSGTDYTLANGTLTIGSGDVSNNITISNVVDDLLDENNETVIVTLSNPTNATLGSNTVHTYTITDNDATPTVAFNFTSSNGLESVSSADLQVDLSAASSLIVTVDYEVTGTANGSGTDYTLADGTLTIATGDASNNITIGSIVDDLLDEDNETVIVTLSNPTNATLGSNTVHTYSITDNDATPTVAFNSTSSNGLESVSSADLQVDLSAASGLVVTVDYVVTGTATGADYTLADGTLTIATGDASDNITIGSIVDDLLDENNETVIVTLSNPTNATLGSNTVHTYTITDNDATPSVAFNSTSSNGLESVGSADLQVDLSTASGLVVTVDYVVTGTATSLAAGTLTIAAGDVNNNITISNIVDDLLDENNETVIVTLSNPTNATLGTNAVHTYTINDDDTAPSVAFNSVSSNGSESVGSKDLHVDLSAVSGLNVSVDYVVTGTATGGGTDYTLASGTLTISAGSVSDNITIASIIDDLLDENNETVIVTLSNPVNATLGTNTVHTYTILDDDATPTVAFTSVSSNGLESVSSADLQVDLSAASGLTVTVDYKVTGTANGGGTDYTLADGTLTLAAGDASDNITIGSIVDDLLDENNETVIVTLSNPTNATLGSNTVHTYTITDNDATPTVAFNSTSSNGLESVSSADLKVDLSAASGLVVTVDYVITGTATAADYTLADGTLTLAAGDASDNITIGSIVDDLLDENNETVIVTLSNPTNATLGTNTVHTYTINDNDAAPSVAFNSVSSNGLESVGSTDLQVDLSAASGLIVEVDYVVTGTASGSGTDYTLANGTLTIGSGDVSNNITISSVIDDLLDENNETVIVTLSNPTNATLGTNTVHTYTINDNDETPVIVSSQSFSVNEDAINTVSVGTVLVTDTDLGTIFGNWTIISGNDDAIFAIDPVSGVIIVEDNSNLDFETQTSYSLRVTVSDGTNTSVAETVTVNVNGVNDNSPVVTENQTFNIAEDIANSGTVGTALATDGDAGTNFSAWTETGGTGVSIFEINASTGAITVTDNGTIDRESTASYTYTVTVSDGTNTSAAETITINITDINDVTPVIISSQSFSVDEDAANTTSVGTVLATDGDATATAFSSWTITAGNGAGVFAINSSTGDITITDNTALDYETTTSYALTLSVSDGTNISATETIVVNVNAINDNTPVIITSQSFSISENIANSGFAGTVLATDGDAGTNFSAWTETGGTGVSIFEINASTGAITVTDNGTIDRESTASYTYTVTVSDGTNTSAAETIAINITDINDVTPVITSSQSFSVDEDAANATSVGTVLATDGDATATVFSSWTITAGNTNGVFAINSSTGEILVNDANELDYESITSYSLSITVSDGVNTSTAETVTVNVNDINDETPVFTSASTINIDENTTDIITLTATDGDAGTTFTFNKIGGDDQALFSINSSTGELAFTSSPDYETPLDVNTDNDYIVEVSVSDGLNSSTQTIIVSVDNVTGIAITSNGGGATAEISIPENSTSIATVTSVNEGVAVPLYSLIGGADQAKFNIHPTSGLLNFVSAPDYELAQDVDGNNSYEVIVRVTGDVGATDDQTITVTITDINDVTPVITASQSFSVNEDAANTTSLGTVLSTDGDAASTTYSSWSITDGNTDGIFAVNSTTGEITVTDNTNLDFEIQTSYSLTVTVSDGTNTSVAEIVTVNVNDVNDNSPVVTASQIFNIAEDIADSGTVGTVLATDADAGTAFSAWTETGGTGASIFEINASTGIITVTDNSGLDYETTTSYSYTVTVSDGTNTSATETITINITDVNDVAPVITASQSFSINEDAANTTSVGTVIATDGDAASTTYSSWTIISGNEDGIFTITPSTGEITIVDNTNLDFERDEIYDLVITVKDGENTSLEGTVRISVIDINEAPTAIQLSNAAIAENSAIGTEVGKLTASDEDKDPTLSFSMAQNEFFELHGDKIVSKEIFDYEDHISYLIQVNVEDQGGLSYSESFTIHIENKNETPRFISEPFVDAVLNESYIYMIEYQDVDADGCIVTAFEKPSWLNLDDNGDGTATLYGLPTEAGTFNVILEASDNEYTARQEFELVVETVTGIEDVLIEPIVWIYPNPVVRELHIDLSDFRNDETTISLFSMTGSLIFKEEHKNVGEEVRIIKSVQQLRSGVYFLIIEFEGHRESYKIVKQ